MTLACIAGLQFGADIYPTEELIRSLVPHDVVNLFIRLPILLGSLGLARRGMLVGLPCWPGALFFVTYNYLAYVFAMPTNWAFILHLVLVTLSGYALSGLVASIAGDWCSCQQGRFDRTRIGCQHRGHIDHARLGRRWHPALAEKSVWIWHGIGVALFGQHAIHRADRPSVFASFPGLRALCAGGCYRDLRDGIDLFHPVRAVSARGGGSIQTIA